MSFTHPAMLFAALLPLIWFAFAGRGARFRFGFFLKALSLCAILAAFAEPVAVLPESKTGALVLVDTSASVSSGDLALASQLAHRILKGHRADWVTAVPFDSRLHSSEAAGLAAGFASFKRSEGPSGDGTNLEAALTGSLAAIPPEYSPRLVLISDGNENQGSVVRAIALLQRLAIPVDTIPLNGQVGGNLRLDAVSMPNEAFSSEPMAIDLSLYAASPSPAVVSIFAEGKLLGQESVRLSPGSNFVRVHARVKSTGSLSISGRVAAKDLGKASWDGIVHLRRAKALYLSQDPEGADSNFMGALEQAGFDVSKNMNSPNADPGSFGLIVLNNLDLAAFSAERKAELERYVKSGGGLLLIGGERQVYKDDRQMDALDRALPADLAPPEAPKGNCVALIIDKSSSMEGRKIELARLSASGVVDHLRAIDTIGVLMFDNSFQWAVPMRRAEDRALIKRLISGITPDGGTQIAPALAEAYRKVLPSKAAFKHIVLLTDGISEEGDSIDLAKEAADHDVTISTVGLGQDVNRGYLEKVATASGGRSYFLNEPMGLEQILLKDVQTFSGSTAVEKSLTPIVTREADILQGVNMESAPPLKGYARFIAKANAESVLQIDKSRKDPLFVRWQYGLVRAAVFASDAKSRWAESWVTWPGFDKFWINVSRDLLMHGGRTEANAEFDSATNEMLVRYRMAEDAPEPPTLPELYVLGPRGFRRQARIEKLADRLYGARVPIGTTSGLFRVRPVNESAAFPEVGLYLRAPEFADRGANENLLRQVSAYTRGRYNPPPETILDTNGRVTYTKWQLWPLCLGIAILLTVAELVVRKWSGLAGYLRRQTA